MVDAAALGRLLAILGQDPTLRELVAAWPDLPEGRREAIKVLTRPDE